MKNCCKKINVMHLAAYLAVGGSSQLLIDALKTFAPNDITNNILVVLSSNIDEMYIKNLSEFGCKYYVIPEKEYVVPSRGCALRAIIGKKSLPKAV